MNRVKKGNNRKHNRGLLVINAIRKMLTFWLIANLAGGPLSGLSNSRFIPSDDGQGQYLKR